MVVNLCLPHFHTAAHCNKLCADGYDVTNLVSADPALRKRGFKLEYFLRPPLQVTLKFGFPVELCRVDVELWPWGMDRGQACKRLEISTSSDPRPSSGLGPTERREQNADRQKSENKPNGRKHQRDGSKCRQSSGHQWSVQPRQWDKDNSPQRDGVFGSQSNAESSSSESEFKLVARCELREETQVSFRHSNFRPRAPFLSPPPPQPDTCRQEKLWSRGLSSLSAVTQLRVTVPFGGAASSLGLKTLAVWGQPAHCCPVEEVERIQRIHESNQSRVVQPAFFAPPIRQITQPLQASPSVSVPEEFLDPITQEVMTLPMLLPGGVSVDTTTLEEYQKREASWGRLPNDPFTGVPFTAASQPLPNPQLKSRIDHFLLQQGLMGRHGMLGRQERGQNPQASRLVKSDVHRQSRDSPCVESKADSRDTAEDSGPSSKDGRDFSNTRPLCADSKSDLDKRKKRDLREISNDSTEMSASGNKLPQAKRARNDSASVPGCSSHEQLLSASLDEALLSALKGRPSFTSNLSRQKEIPSDSTEQCQGSGSKSTPACGETCSACSCSVSAYSVLCVYRLICGHLLCRACLQKEPTQPNTNTVSRRVSCPACRSFTPHGDVVRVHH
ncbi:RING finger protein 37 [Kryptolebias marmoratus]|uniref:U-box domain containing 5 n=1 Tax=Kryptolebias marmoratus TaxID=37003 RepID=A0A3Q3EDS1_KRYMA|nr:RING finger protein 37 [Kryptolebias marmoratus]